MKIKTIEVEIYPEDLKFIEDFEGINSAEKIKKLVEVYQEIQTLVLAINEHYQKKGQKKLFTENF